LVHNGKKFHLVPNLSKSATKTNSSEAYIESKLKKTGAYLNKGKNGICRGYNPFTNSLSEIGLEVNYSFHFDSQQTSFAIKPMFSKTNYNVVIGCQMDSLPVNTHILQTFHSETDLFQWQQE
jgi:hypothetical protein